MRCVGALFISSNASCNNCILAKFAPNLWHKHLVEPIGENIARHPNTVLRVISDKQCSQIKILNGQGFSTFPVTSRVIYDCWWHLHKPLLWSDLFEPENLRLMSLKVMPMSFVAKLSNWAWFYCNCTLVLYPVLIWPLSF